MKIHAAIDVGKDGAIVVFEDGNIVLKSVTPTIGNQIDLLAIRDMLSGLKREHTHIVVEDVHAIHGAAAKSTFNFGWSLGILEGMLAGLQLAYTKVAPKEWQKEMWQGVNPVYKPNKGESNRKHIDTKATSLIAAKRLFPSVDFTKSDRATKAHDGIVDALLMAEYCRRKY